MKQILVLAFCFSSFLAFSQDGFSKSYDLGNAAASFANIVLDGDHIVVTGTTRIDSLNQWGVLFARLDTFGNVLDYQVHLDSLGDWLLVTGNNSLIELSNGDFAISVHPFWRKSGILMRLDSIGDLVSFYEYPDSTNLTVFQRDILELQDGFLIGGFEQHPVGLVNTYIIRTDNQGNKLWEKSYGTNDWNNFFTSFTKRNENEFIVGHGISSPSNTPYLSWQSKTRIIAIDSLGNIKNEWTSNFNDREAGAIGLQVDSEGSITYTSNYLHAFSDFEAADQHKVVQLDSNYNVLWTKIIGQPTDIMNTIWDLKQTPDGDWIAIGNETTPPLDSSYQYRGGWLHKVSSVGDSVWSRLDTIGFHPMYSTDNYLTGGVVLPSGSIIACGYYDFYDPPKTFA